MRATARPIRIEGNLAYVPLTRGYEAVIDVEDVPLVDGAFWQATIQRRKDGTIKAVYARRKVRIGPRKWLWVPMHRLLTGAGEGAVVDHADTNGLNNRRANLRVASPSENCMNRRTRADSRSQIKGVYWLPRRQKWRAKITVAGRQIHIGTFDRVNDAAAAYATASAELHGEFGRVS